MQIPEPELQSYYTARAPEYDQVYLKPERQSDLREIERWLPPHFAGAAVLEVACGTGYWTQFIAQSAVQVVAIDASPETMRLAEHRVPKSNVQFLIGDAYNLPQQLGKFSAAFAGFWFSHVPRAKRHKFLQGLNALLMPGSTVILLDNRYVEGNSSPITETDSDRNTYQTRQLKDGSIHRVLKNFPSESELQSLLHGIGKGGTFSIWQYYWAFKYVATAP
jgi:demethylmenaquinone methyltransferase/2-methoxy-6-polyprenyl-1,4-benzoquinol methylase